MSRRKNLTPKGRANVSPHERRGGAWEAAPLQRQKRHQARYLAAARLASAWGMATIVQVAVDMPEGYFGAADQITRYGAVYAALLTLLTALAIFGLVRQRRWAASLVPVLLSVNVGLFIPPMAADPLRAGVVVLWNLMLLAQHLIPPGSTLTSREALDDELADWLVRVGPAVRHLATLSLMLTVAVVGYRLSGRWLALAVCFVLNGATVLWARHFLRLLLAQRSRFALLVLGVLGASLLAVARPELMLSLLATAQLLLLALLIARERGTAEVLASFFNHPSRLIFFSFASVILLGTVLLTFPGASAHGKTISPIDALFTATSATCVTGLIVLDTPHDFSPLGQAIILGLIQVGGLGIMVLSTFATLLLGGSLGLRGERALKEVLEIQADRTAYLLTRFIVISTLSVEAVGAVLLAFFFAGHGLEAGEALWRGVFHSVSAFCNAGFALQSDSLVGFQHSPGVLLTVALLITLGGLGFAVMAGLWGRLRAAPGVSFNLQVRVVLVTSALLVAAGWLLYLALEWQASLAGMGWGDKLVNGLFQSVTLRTAGFNSVSFEQLAPATALLMMLFMFVGASPGSTGGGIKTTTLAVLLAAIAALVRGTSNVTLFDREIARATIFRSLGIVVISSLVAFGSLFLLLIFESQPFQDLAFETVSAVGTVGLSLGATAKLSAAGKLVIIGAMFIGRIGPLTLALVLGGGRIPRYRYPTGRIMVG